MSIGSALVPMAPAANDAERFLRFLQSRDANQIVLPETRAVIAEAFHERTQLLSTGALDRGTRPPDVAAAAAAPHGPFVVDGLTPAQSARLLHVTGLATQIAPARLQLNRSPESLLNLVRGGGRIHNLYDHIGDPRNDWGSTLRSTTQRLAFEQREGSFGYGTTVFASPQFGGPMLHPARPLGTADAHSGAEQLRLNTGALQFGRGSLIMRPSVLPATMFQPLDTGLLTDARIQPKDVSVPFERMNEAFARAIAMHHTAEHPGNHAAFLGTNFEGQDLLPGLVAAISRPDAEAARDVARYLQSEAMTRAWGQANVQLAHATDAAAMHVQRPNARMYGDGPIPERELAVDRDLAEFSAATKFPVRFAEPGEYPDHLAWNA